MATAYLTKSFSAIGSLLILRGLCSDCSPTDTHPDGSLETWSGPIQTSSMSTLWVCGETHLLTKETCLMHFTPFFSRMTDGPSLFTTWYGPGSNTVVCGLQSCSVSVVWAEHNQLLGSCCPLLLIFCQQPVYPFPFQQNLSVALQHLPLQMKQCCSLLTSVNLVRSWRLNNNSAGLRPVTDRGVER